MIIISDDVVWHAGLRLPATSIWLARWDDGDVYNGLVQSARPGLVAGTVNFIDGCADVNVERIGAPVDEVRILVPRELPVPAGGQSDAFVAVSQKVRGYVRRGERWESRPVQIVPVSHELASRFGGILETEKLKSKTVLLAGLGSGGSLIALWLAQCGVGGMIIVDHDRLDAANAGRHDRGLSESGRLKTRAMRDRLLDKNPHIRIKTSERKIGWDSLDEVREYVRDSDLTICGIDERQGRRVLNKVCVDEDKPLIMAGVFERAHGGQVLRVRPRKSACYQCLLMSLPRIANDQEISSQRAAEAVAYADRAVPIMPGLSIEIAPVANLVALLTMEELQKGDRGGVRSRERDLVAPLYLWLNRREPETDYATLEPLEYNIDGMHILRWYGIALSRRPDCPCCGDFAAHLQREHGISLEPEDLKDFTGDAASRTCPQAGGDSAVGLESFLRKGTEQP